MLARRALAVVAVADRAPRDTGFAVVLGDVGERAGGAVDLILAFAHATGERIDHADEQVARDVLEVTAVLEPRTGGRDVVGGALALGFHQDGQAEVVVAVPRRERLEQLESIAGRADDHLYIAAVGRRRRERVLARVVAPTREHLAHRWFEHHLGPVIGDDRLRRGVEVECAGQREGDDGVGRGDERERARRTVVALREVPVVRVDDRVRTPGDARRPRPLADARSAGVGEHRRADGFEIGEQSVTLDGRSDLLRSWRDEQLDLGLQAVRRGLAGDRRRPCDVLVRRVGARTDERRGDLERPVVRAGGITDLATDAMGAVGGVRSVDQRLQLVEVDLDQLVVRCAIVGPQVVDRPGRQRRRSPRGPSP